MISSIKKAITNLPLSIWVISIFVFITSLLFSWLLFDNIPHVHDEIAYLFQAKIFSLGKLYVPSPCGSEFFDFPHIINNGRWYSQYPPGFPFLLMLGLLVRAPWLINPLLGSLSIIIFFKIGNLIYGRRAGIISALLGATSPFLLIMSSTFMSHPSCMFFLAGFLLLFFYSLKELTLLRGIGMGICLGMAIIIRPFSAVLFSLPILAFYIFMIFKNKLNRRMVSHLWGFFFSVSFFMGLFLVFNFLTNGHPLRTGYEVCYGRDVLPGFGHKGCYQVAHTPYLG